ncbi:hypothetical protein [Chitinophaga agri]|uniref:Uncharacterized protein n=1 Tax=Chitinophaga agri TaxID=2703787 RepID=A0A6B9ZAD0_9BACT|nr:hypothetical protein [Chitinophaga agri]QHS58451.1 hypothetical protein GWR21_02220 [Chitinophaga agri]
MEGFKYVMATLGSFIVVVFLLALLFIPGQDDLTTHNIIEINSPVDGGKAFIHFKNWGISADHQRVFISGKKNEKFVPDESADYIYNGLDAVYYKQRKDTLFIYCAIVSAVPVHYSGGITVVQTGLGDAEMMDLYKDNNYLKKGLRVSQ